MKIIVITGGLGNQMFQYAFYLELKQRNAKAVLNTSLYSQIKIHNGYELERCFDIKKKNKGKFYSLLTRLVIKFNFLNIVYTDNGYFSDAVFRTRACLLNGYWQSEDYFPSIRSKIKEVFQFQGIDNENKKIAEEMNSCTSVSLHIRRGDYLNTNYYCDLSKNGYYISAIEFIKSEIKEATDLFFYVFSNDEIFTKNFIFKERLKNVKIININNGLDNYKDMYLMSQCKHNIIANSSFSWWGAYINSNPKKIVVSPEKWFNNQIEATRIVPESWIKI